MDRSMERLGRTLLALGILFAARVVLAGLPIPPVFPLPTPDSFPNGIAAGPDGNMWFTEGAGRIGRITLDGTLKEFTIPSDFSARVHHRRA